MERPILFSTPMVQAILDGRKTQTRRRIKIDPIMWEKPTNVINNVWSFHYGPGGCQNYSSTPEFMKCPYGQIGDILWVRETWFDAGHYFVYKADGKNGMLYLGTDDDGPVYEHLDNYKWKPSIHMPKEACRIKLIVKDIRVERLQEMSYTDALDEGVEYKVFDNDHYYKNYLSGEITLSDDFRGNAINSYQSLWESINGKGSWERNPWVWVIEFKNIGLVKWVKSTQEIRDAVTKER